MNFDRENLTLEQMIVELPQNRALYKDSDLWAVRADEMEEIIYKQGLEESFLCFIKRIHSLENSFDQFFIDYHEEYKKLNGEV